MTNVTATVSTFSLDELIEEVNRLNRLLADACNELDYCKRIQFTRPELQQWWKSHKDEVDKHRRAQHRAQLENRRQELMTELLAIEERIKNE